MDEKELKKLSKELEKEDAPGCCGAEFRGSGKAA